MATDNDTKVYENRLRRKAARQGLHLSKSGRRDPHAQDYGLFVLIDRHTGKAVHQPDGQFVHGWTLNDVEKYLLNKPASVRKQITKRSRAAKSKPTLPVSTDDEWHRRVVWDALREFGLVSGDLPPPKPKRKPEGDR